MGQDEGSLTDILYPLETRWKVSAGQELSYVGEASRIASPMCMLDIYSERFSDCLGAYAPNSPKKNTAFLELISYCRSSYQRLLLTKTATRGLKRFWTVSRQNLIPQSREKKVTYSQK